MLNVETHVFHSPQSYSSTETLWQKFCMVLFILQDLFFKLLIILVLLFPLSTITEVSTWYRIPVYGKNSLGLTDALVFSIQSPVNNTVFIVPTLTKVS